MKKFAVQTANGVEAAEYEIIDGVLWIRYQDYTFSHTLVSKKKSRSKSTNSASEGGTLTALMPGKITKIFKAVGDAVAKGEAVIAMEAMKMEYTLKSETHGLIKSISCQPLQQVSIGEVLVTIEEKKES